MALATGVEGGVGGEKDRGDEGGGQEDNGEQEARHTHTHSADEARARLHSASDLPRALTFGRPITTSPPRLFLGALYVFLCICVCLALLQRTLALDVDFPLGRKDQERAKDAKGGAEQQTRAHHLQDAARACRVLQLPRGCQALGGGVGRATGGRRRWDARDRTCTGFGECVCVLNRDGLERARVQPGGGATACDGFDMTRCVCVCVCMCVACRVVCRMSCVGCRVCVCV